jgi:hypothetical protein
MFIPRPRRVRHKDSKQSHIYAVLSDTEVEDREGDGGGKIGDLARQETFLDLVSQLGIRLVLYTCSCFSRKTPRT